MADKLKEKQAYDEGFLAGDTGISRSRNPYLDKNSDLERYWNKGHDRATAGLDWENLE